MNENVAGEIVLVTIVILVLFIWINRCSDDKLRVDSSMKIPAKYD